MENGTHENKTLNQIARFYEHFGLKLKDHSQRVYYVV